MSESCCWWKSGMKFLAEWTFEGGPNNSRRRRETQSVINRECMIVHDGVDVYINLSGTADNIPVSRISWGGIFCVTGNSKTYCIKLPGGCASTKRMEAAYACMSQIIIKKENKV